MPPWGLPGKALPAVLFGRPKAAVNCGAVHQVLPHDHLALSVFGLTVEGFSCQLFCDMKDGHCTQQERQDFRRRDYAVTCLQYTVR